MDELTRIKELAIQAAREAGRCALEHIEKIGKISYKDSVKNLVTDIDKKCEGIIIDKIRKYFPEHSILAEESGETNNTGKFKWIIDPIDGTTNYAHGFPFFCTSIGIMQSDSLKIGVVYDPSRDELFAAEEGKGAFLNKKPIKVSQKTKVQDSLIATGFAYDINVKRDNIPYFEKLLEEAQAIRRAGSAAIDLCYVACGRFDGFWEMGLNSWDTAAGVLIVQEANGRVTAMDGRSFDIFQKNILATNSFIHDEMIKLLSA